MATATKSKTGAPTADRKLVEMNWDPITRIVGSLGIYTKIDFENREVAECHSTSSIFRGYSIFMKGKDPRDAHFITSRICGICGDNHATCATYAQNMAFGVVPPAIAEWIVNLGEAAEYMFDHNIFQDNLVGVDFCEQMVKETNPSVWTKAQKTEAPNAKLHGFRTIADIMTALNPFTGAFYREALQTSRYTREMFCLMEGKHVHPSTLYPGGVGTVPTVQLFTDYLVRLMRYMEFMKKVVPLHDDLFDFFYEALPGYEKVGQRRVLLGCWGSFNNPDVCDYTYKKMTDWGRAMYVTPGVVVDDKLVTTDLVDINLNIRILLGSSYYEGWENSRLTPPPVRSISANRRWPSCMRVTPRPGRNSKCRRKRSAADSTKLCAACFRITSSSAMARSPTIIHTRRRRGTPTRATSTVRPGLTKTRCKTRRSSRRTGRISSKALTSCVPCAASIHACPVACICTWGTARCSKRTIRRCSACMGSRKSAKPLERVGKLRRGKATSKP